MLVKSESTNFPWSILEYLDPYVEFCKADKSGLNGKQPFTFCLCTENFINKCFNFFFKYKIHFVKENLPTVGEKVFLLVLPFLGMISLQTRTKSQQALKGVLNCGKLEIPFK